MVKTKFDWSGLSDKRAYRGSADVALKNRKKK